MTRHVNLQLEIIEWSEDGETRVKEITYDGHGGLERSAVNRFCIKGAPTNREIELLAELCGVLNELCSPYEVGEQ